MLKFIKYKRMFAHGYSNEIIECLGDFDSDEDLESTLKEWLDEKHTAYNWSDKYRGIDYDVIDNPGNEWLLKDIERLKDSAKALLERADNFTKLLS